MSVCYREIHYDANIGRFLQSDPDPGRLNFPLSVNNKYAYVINNPQNLVDPSGASIFSDIGDGFKHISSELGDEFGKVGSIVIHKVIFGPIGTLTAVNTSGQFSEKDQKIVNFAAAVAFNVALGPVEFATTSVSALTQPGDFVGNFTSSSSTSVLTEGAKGLSPFIRDVVGAYPVKAAAILYRLKNNHETINRRTDRACRWVTFNDCPL